MNLLELQRQMAQDVMQPLTANFDMCTETEDGAWKADIVSGYIKPSSALTSFERLEIYNRQYWLRVIGAVAEDFPALQAVLGPRKFDVLVRAYLQENPSTSFTLRDLGKNLPAWLPQHPAFTGARSQLAEDVARLEWAYVEAFDEASLPPLHSSTLAGMGPDSTLSLQPHLQLLDLRYLVDEFVLSVHRSIPEVDIVSNAAKERTANAPRAIPRLPRSPLYLVVHRFDNSVYYRRIDREAFRLLSALREGQSLAEAIAAAFARSRHSQQAQAAMIQEYFAHAAQLGWFAESNPDEAPLRGSAHVATAQSAL